jgi:hypothetical protein
MKSSKKIRETSLVKLDSELYKKIREFVKMNKLEYPSIKHFVESSVMKSLGFKRYDIEGVDADSRSSQLLSDVVGNPSGNYTMCSLCNKVFFKNKLDKRKIRMCPSCTKITEQYSDLVNEDKQRNAKVEIIKYEESKKPHKPSEVDDGAGAIQKILKREIEKLRVELMEKIEKEGKK